VPALVDDLMPDAPKTLEDTGLSSELVYHLCLKRRVGGYIVNFAINGCDSFWFPHYIPQFLHSVGS